MTSSHRRAAARVTALVVVLAAPLLYLNAPKSVADSPIDWLSDAHANAAATTVAQALAPIVNDDTYMGIAVTPGGLEISLSAPPTSTQGSTVKTVLANESAILSGFSAPPVVPISFRQVQASMAALTEVTNLLSADQVSWAEQGINLSAWGPDYSADNVSVHLAHYDLAAAEKLENTYGSIVSVSPDAFSVGSSSRTADSAPWYGGDEIKMVSGNTSTYCTSWFAVRNSSNSSIMPTAAHCGAGTWTQNGHTFGKVTSRTFSGAVDGELIPVTSNSYKVWSDPTSTSRVVTGEAGVETLNGLVCTDGYVDREVCNVQIVGVNQSISYDGVTITGVTAANQKDGKAAFTPGDSGGPVEITSGSSSTLAEGMIVSHNNTTNAKGYYIPAKTITNHFAVSILTN